MATTRKRTKKWKHRFDSKPLSANKMFYRAKQMTREYREYREFIYEDIDNRKKWPFKPEDHLDFDVKVGFSSKLADVDNCIKPLLDTFQYMFDFNDRYVFKVTIEKEYVKKGEEYFDVTVTEYGGK